MTRTQRFRHRTEILHICSIIVHILVLSDLCLCYKWKKLLNNSINTTDFSHGHVPAKPKGKIDKKLLSLKLGIDKTLKSFLKSYDVSIPIIKCKGQGNQRLCHLTFTYNNEVFRANAFVENRVFDPVISNISFGSTLLTNKEKKSYAWHQLLRGKILGHAESTVFLLLSGDLKSFKGFATTNNKTIVIEPLSLYSNRSKAENMDKMHEYVLYEPKNIENWNQTKTSYFQTRTSLFTTLGKTLSFKEMPRIKRSENAPSSYACTLHVVVDHIFFQDFGEGTVPRTVSEIAYLVGVADLIFRGTDFNGDGFGDNIGFFIQEFTIYPSASAEGNKFALDSSDSMDYLDRLSSYDFSRVCLGYGFTYRDFNDGVVGVAYIGNSNRYGSVGGICQPPVSQGSGTSYSSYNTGVLTTQNFGSRLDSFRSALTLTHELGHSFGSTHDEDDTSCAPDNEYGNFIMYPFSQDGTLANHNKFSACSINMMYPVIRNKGYCFVRSSESLCGNGLQEKGEECDCGSKTTCDMLQDDCCVPSDSSNAGDEPCTFKRKEGKVCSPLTSPCCTYQCDLRPLSDKHQCSKETECRENSFCDGLNETCPLGQPKMDGRLCGNNRKLCKDGRCSMGICEGNGLFPCDCRDVACKTCCRWKNSSICQTLEQLNLGYPPSVTGAFTPGELCNTRKGICDQSGKCIVPDYDNTLKRLLSVFGEEGAEDAVAWFKIHWYYLIFVLVGITLLSIIAILIKGKTNTTHFQAFRIGRYLKVMEQIKQERELLCEKFDSTMTLLEKRVNDIQTGREKREYTDALARLCTFFPTAPKDVIIQSLTTTSHEELAVEVLIIKGYPLRKLIIKNKTN